MEFVWDVSVPSGIIIAANRSSCRWFRRSIGKNLVVACLAVSCVCWRSDDDSELYVSYLCRWDTILQKTAETKKFTFKSQWARPPAFRIFHTTRPSKHTKCNSEGGPLRNSAPVIAASRICIQQAWCLTKLLARPPFWTRSQTHHNIISSTLLFQQSDNENLR